jgi:hypothetical protein
MVRQTPLHKPSSGRVCLALHLTVYTSCLHVSPDMCVAGLSKSLKLHKERGDPGEGQTPEGSKQGDRDDSAKPRHQSSDLDGAERKPSGPSYKLTGETGSYRLVDFMHCWGL